VVSVEGLRHGVSCLGFVSIVNGLNIILPF